MDTYRFHVPTLAAIAQSNALIPLSEDQARHAGLVLRLTPGEPVELFDGQGASIKATIAGDEGQRLKHKVLVQPTGTLHRDPPPPIELTLATCIPKGDRADWLIEQASQLNVARVLWLDADRSVVKLKETSGKLEKFRRLAIESAKQCGRNRLLQIDLAPPLASLLSTKHSALSTDVTLWLEPREGGTSVPEMIQKTPAKKILALIGPEGGWSQREFYLLESAATAGQIHRVHLTPTILRIETACSAIAAILMGA